MTYQATSIVSWHRVQLSISTYLISSRKLATRHRQYSHLMMLFVATFMPLRRPSHGSLEALRFRSVRPSVHALILKWLCISRYSKCHMLIPFWKKYCPWSRVWEAKPPSLPESAETTAVYKVYLEKANVELLQAYWRLQGTFPVEDGIDTIRYEMLF